ncbi:MAG: Ig-like domain repeat protein [Micropruina sp.]|uniref:Ig-like domain repeat protein n=1 Tax=Micropruina sp. TaxID=2737536 RepID=UPI0039E41BFC
MRTASLRLRALATGTLAVLIAGLGAITAPSPAHAAPTTITDPVSGASITLSSSVIAPGQRVEISGTGFVATQGSTGETLVAVRPYDYDAGPAWTIGGEDAYLPASSTVPPGSEAKHWFITDHTANGSFRGWIQAPANLTATGPLGGGNHWLRILSGAFFTTTGDRLTDPITFKVPFTVAGQQSTAQLSTGLTSPTNVFQAGNHFRPGAQVTLTGTGFSASTAASVTLDGSTLSSTISTDAAGALPTSARVTLPGQLATGQHTLKVSTGAVSASATITVTPPPTASVLTMTVRPGGTIAYDLTGYIGVSGKPQKVAAVVAEQVLECIQTDAAGKAGGVLKLPAGVTDPLLIRFNVGLSCVLPPAGVINDQPISSVPQTLTVRADAPEIAAVGNPAPGAQFTLTGSGFSAGGSVRISVGGSTAGQLTADAAGRISGPVTAPNGTGSLRVLATQGSTVAATSVTLGSKRAAALTLSAPSKLSYGAARSTTVRLSVGGSAASGSVLVQQGSWSTTVAVAASGTSVALPRDAAVGSHTVTASFAGDDRTSSATASRSFRVQKASASASIKLSSSKVKKSKRAKATITVSIAGAPASLSATGSVKLYDGKKKIAGYTLKASHHGVLKVTLPKITKKGTHKLKIVYGGNGNVSGKTSKTVSLKVS